MHLSLLIRLGGSTFNPPIHQSFLLKQTDIEHLAFLVFFSTAFFGIDCNAQSIALEAGNTIGKKLLKGINHIYTLPLRKGEYAECVVMPTEVDLAIDLIAPWDKKIQLFDSPNGFNSSEPVTVVRAETGNYQLHIHPMIEGQADLAEKVHGSKNHFTP